MKPAGAMLGITVEPFVTPLTSVWSKCKSSSGLLTVTEMSALVVVLPAKPIAMALKVCDPFAELRLFQE